MISNIKLFYKNNTYYSILLIGLFLRLVAVLFSKGYGMHDDHFLIIEASKSWVDGFDYNRWLPWNQANPTPSGHSFFYVGIHFLIFTAFKWLGLTNPDTAMYFIRLFHAVYSLLIISLSYKITLKLSNKTVANTVGVLLATLWVMPFLSVRNLVEIVAIPPLLASVWVIIKDDKKSFFKYFFAGIIGALAFSIRFQTSLFIGGIGLAILFQKNWKQTIYYGLGVVFSIVLIQGTIDYFIWNKPFTELTEYINYNITHKNDYGSGAWYSYILVLAGLTVPPLGLLLFLAMFNIKKKLLILFIPTILFFAFHTYFPNKQERFIFPIFPMFLILGFIGIDNLLNGKLNNEIWRKIYKFSFIFFVIINIILLPFVSIVYSKKARVEAMLFLKDKPQTEILLVDGTNKNGYKMLPQYYMKKWARLNIIENTNNYKNINSSYTDKYIILFGNDNLTSRLDSIETHIGEITLEYKAIPSFVDYVLNKLNDNNANDTLYIYSKKSTQKQTKY
jgi:hypothetical protein